MMRAALLTLLLAALPALAGIFSDVPPDHWAAPAIEELTKQGVLQGSPDGQYHGTKPVSRYEFAVMGARMLHLAPKMPAETTPGDLPFADVRDAHWATRSVAELFHTGIIQGSPDGQYHGDKPLARYDFAVMATRLLGAVLGPDAIKSDAADRPFADVPVDHYAAPSLRALVQLGVLLGTPEAAFEGDKPLSRYDFAAAGAKVVRLILATRPAE